MDGGVLDAASALDVASSDGPEAPDDAAPPRPDGQGLADGAPADRPELDATAADSAGTPACPSDRPPDQRFCDATTSRPCGLSTGGTCHCEPVCSGVPPLPGMEYAWVCRQPEPAGCPATRPVDGAACTTDDLVCVYGYCGGWTARCQGGRWSVTFVPPPP